MKAGAWDRLQRVYHEAIEVPSDARAGYVREACGADTVLRRQVESLLDAATGDDEFLRGPVRNAQIVAAYQPGEFIGPYRIERELGAGGMGVAFLAERGDEQFRKQVALKVMRFGMTDAHLRARFQAERQILATLEHPNIARLLDGGETSSGAPYIVMEYVDGERVTDFGARLPVRARIELFQKVCAAVRYAHMNLVVHRDIKPSNILVTADGEPKLLDFGVAKILLPELAMVETQTGLAPFTPRYASPEQMLGKPASTACDIYSLGVTLYELLTGRVPYPETNIADLALAFARRDAAPPGIDAGLDAVVLKAIQQDPALRYASVEEFSRDLDRYVQGYPVEARRVTWSYRAQKFVARNTLAVSAGTAAAVLAVVGIAGILWQAQVAGRERVRAERRFQDVQELARKSLFEFDTAVRDLPGGLPARRLLVATASEYLERLARDAGADAVLTADLADSYLKLGNIQGNPGTANLGDPESALKSYAKAEALVERIPGRSARMRLLMASARRRRAQVLRHSNPAAALAELRKSAEIAEAVTKDEPTNVDGLMAWAGIQDVLGDVLGGAGPGLGDLDGALEAYRKGAEGWSRVLALDRDPETRAKVAIMKFKIGDVMTDWGDAAGAVVMDREADALSRQSLAEARGKPNERWMIEVLANALVRLGRAQTEIGSFSAADATLSEGASLFEGLARADPKDNHAADNLVFVYSTIASSKEAAGDKKTALVFAGRARALTTGLVNGAPGDVYLQRIQAEVMLLHGGLLQAGGFPERGKEECRSAIHQLRTLAERPEATAVDFAAFGQAVTEVPFPALRDARTAVRYGRKAVAAAPATARYQARLAEALMQSGDPAGAIESGQKALSLMRGRDRDPQSETVRKLKRDLARYQAAGARH